MIKITVKCFSQVRYALGENEIDLNLENRSNGKLDGVFLRIAVNQQYQAEETELKDGDEVAFIPPVQGG